MRSVARNNHGYGISGFLLSDVGLKEASCNLRAGTDSPGIAEPSE
jgi:hypothetical protein